MNNIDATKMFIEKEAARFGAKTDTEFNKPYVLRDNTGGDALKDNGAYFGFIHPDEEAAGPFHDFSLTIFPNDQGKAWLVCLGIGSMGFKNDYELATYPGLRRLFSKLVDSRGFCKSDFSDIESSLPKSFMDSADIQHIKNTIKTYTKVLPVCQIVDDPESEVGQRTISAFVAGYARLRNWPTNQTHRKAISDVLEPFVFVQAKDDETEVCNLLRERKFVVIQGAPGTGKTRLAKIVANKLNSKVFLPNFTPKRHTQTLYTAFDQTLRQNPSRT